MNKLLHNNTLFTLTLLGIATALAFLFFSFVSENTANIALLYIIAQILIARYTNGYLHGLFSSVFSVICINFFFTYPFFRLNFTLSGYPVTFIGMLIITLLTTATTSRLKKQTEILAKQEKQVQIARQESLRANLLRAVSHNLRTPLTSIIGTTSSLLSDGSILSDAEKRELLENALIHSGSSHSPELTVTDHPDHVTFCVKDFGHGLNPDVIPDIFVASATILVPLTPTRVWESAYQSAKRSLTHTMVISKPKTTPMVFYFCLHCQKKRRKTFHAAKSKYPFYRRRTKYPYFC